MTSGGMLKSTDVIKGRWQVQKKIGQGAFGEIYCCHDVETSEPVAIKIERHDNKKSVLKLEVSVLRRLQVTPQVCRFINCGRWEEYNYVVMELLGDNLSDLRRQQPDGKFSMGTTLRLGMQMLRAIEGMHNLGYLHRDIKPSNFAMGLHGRSRQCIMIDFGLARKFRMTNGEIRPPRDQAGFRGTARYASIFSHRLAELGRRDDLWSLFYLLVEFAVGQLPWRKVKEKEEIGVLKEKYTSKLVVNLPKEFKAFLDHLNSLKYEDAPEYDYVYSLLYGLYQKEGISDDAPYDWETHRVHGRKASVDVVASGNDFASGLSLERTNSVGSMKSVDDGSPLKNRRPSAVSSSSSGNLRHIAALRRSSSSSTPPASPGSPASKNKGSTRGTDSRGFGRS